MSLKFVTQTRIKFREADPAQIMYFANVFDLAHDAFEEFIVAAGYRWEEWFHKGEFMIPIRHTEADFHSPFFPGQVYDIEVSLASMGTTSFKMKYIFMKKDKVHAVVQMVHAVLDMKTKQKTTLPEIMKQRLTPYLETHGQ